MRRLEAFAREESGQDLVEYSLLLAFICLTAAATLIGIGDSIRGLWAVTNNRLTAANGS